MSALSSWNLLPTSDPSASQINESEHIIDANADLLQSLSEESVDESKPYYRDGEWLLALSGSQGLKRTVVGRLDVASRRRERYTLTFIIDPGKTKKFYLCEFCQAAGETVWIYYRNYAAQHIPRHHAVHCKPCSSCQKLVFRPLLPSHNRFCSGGTTKRRRRAHPEFVAIEPAEALSSSQVSARADKVEELLISRGLTVARGESSHCVGYPVAEDDLAKEDAETVPASPPTRDTTGEQNFPDELEGDDHFPLMLTGADLFLSDNAAFDDGIGNSDKWMVGEDDRLSAWWPPPLE